MIRALLISLLFVLIACGNKDSNEKSSLNQTDSIQSTKMTVSQIDSFAETLLFINKKVIYGDSICNENRNFTLTSFDKYLFDKLNQIDSLKESLGQSISLKIIGKGERSNSFQTLYALRDWGEWFCTIELLVFNPKWELTGYEVIAGVGGEDGETDIGNCKFIDHLKMEITWTSEKKYFESEEPDTKIDSTIVEKNVTEIKINSDGTLSKGKLKNLKKKI